MFTLKKKKKKVSLFARQSDGDDIPFTGPKAGPGQSQLPQGFPDGWQVPEALGPPWLPSQASRAARACQRVMLRSHAAAKLSHWARESKEEDRIMRLHRKPLSHVLTLHCSGNMCPGKKNFDPRRESCSHGRACSVLTPEVVRGFPLPYPATKISSKLPITNCTPGTSLLGNSGPRAGGLCQRCQPCMADRCAPRHPFLRGCLRGQGFLDNTSRIFLFPRCAPGSPLLHFHISGASSSLVLKTENIKKKKKSPS